MTSYKKKKKRKTKYEIAFSKQAKEALTQNACSMYKFWFWYDYNKMRYQLSSDNKKISL